MAPLVTLDARWSTCLILSAVVMSGCVEEDPTPPIITGPSEPTVDEWEQMCPFDREALVAQDFAAFTVSRKDGTFELANVSTDHIELDGNVSMGLIYRSEAGEARRCDMIRPPAVLVLVIPANSTGPYRLLSQVGGFFFAWDGSTSEDWTRSVGVP